MTSGGETNYCWQVVIGDRKGDQGAACTARRPPPKHPIGQRIYIPVGSVGKALAAGTVSPEVAEVRFYVDDGTTASVTPIDAPGELELPVRFYFARLPWTRDGELFVYDGDGDILAHERLAGGP